jgi:hypothetical protein
MKSISIYDSSLTPANAVFKGFEYIDDVIISNNSKKQSIKDFLKTIKENNFRLGIPMHIEHDYMGLYIPSEDFTKTT